MTLVKCKECGDQVSTKAKFCPSCGAKRTKRKSILLWILAGLFGYVFYMASQGTLPKNTTTKTALTSEQKAKIKAEGVKRAQKSFETETIYNSKKAIKALLKDQNSAQFKNVFYNETKKGGPVACGQVNSKNSLGAYTGYQRFISNGKTTLLEEKENNLADKWVALCLAIKP